MKSSRKFIRSFFGLLVFTTAVHANMIPVAGQDAECQQSPRSSNRANLQCGNLSSTYNSVCIADIDEWSVEFLDKANADVGQNSEIQHIKGLTSGPNSLKLCLSAMISLGLCCSTHCLKRLSLGFVPEWYHEGGPFQIGHSHALMPSDLCSAPAYCFIQPDFAEDNNLPKYCFKTVISLWRKSQFTPTVIASRGPPNMS